MAEVFTTLQFWVEIDGIQEAGFAECSGLGAETEVTEYAEGGWNSYTHKLVGRTKFSTVTLKRGFVQRRVLEEWFVASIDGVPNRRKNITITLYAPDRSVAGVWVLREAVPVRWSAPEMRTEAGAVAMETVEFAHHGLLSMPTRN